MLPAPTRDRCEILHLASRLRLSPAVRDGTPALVPVGEQAGRCGWEPFFAALGRDDLWVTEGEGGAVGIAPRGVVLPGSGE